jgi:hypothetical protein
MVSERRAFGDRVRRHRERRGVTLQSIAHSTKIPAALFAGLERGDCSRWPAGVYSRAYIKAYAEAIGLDPAETVEDFTAAFGETVWPDGDGPARRTRAAAAALRLTMDDEPDKRQAQAVRRTALAGADLLVVLVLIALAQYFLNAGLWTTMALAIGYYAVGRVVSDEPFVAWVAGRFRSPQAPPEADEEVGVTDIARTTA